MELIWLIVGPVGLVFLLRAMPPLIISSRKSYLRQRWKRHFNMGHPESHYIGCAQCDWYSHKLRELGEELIPKARVL